MRNRLQVSFWGLHLAADGIVAVAAALLIVLVFALLLTLRFEAGSAHFAWYPSAAGRLVR